MSSFKEKTLDIRPIYKGRIIEVEVARVRLPDSGESYREVVKHPGAVAVLPFTEDDRLVVVRQFRKPLEKEIIEIPAGKLEKGEEPLHTAERELFEETGYQAGQLRFITSFYTSPGFANELLYLYEATQLQSGKPQTDGDEFVETRLITLEEGWQLLENQQIHDAKTVFALYYWQNKKLQQLNQSD